MLRKWRIKRYYFNQLYSGAKHIEVRVGYGEIKKTVKGDLISFDNYGPNEFRVRDVRIYKTFAEMLSAEGVENVLPGETYEDALEILTEIYPPEKEALGVYAFDLSNTATEKKLYVASDLAVKNKKMFSKVVAEAYSATDWISEDYPDHFTHFFTKYVPGILDGTRQIIAVYVGKKIAGVAILKKCEAEQKVSTLFVGEAYRGNGIATKLLERSFDWLGTTKPLITIADYKLPQFEKIIKKYEWELTQTLDGYYNGHSKELVYNGSID